MRGPVLVVVQMILSVMWVALVMPMVVHVWPSAASARTGPAVAGSLVLVIFVIFRIVWPNPRRPNP